MSKQLKGRIFEGEAELEGNLELKEPKLYVVILHNDDYTTMDFVVSILMKIFQKSHVEAAQIMMDVHEKGEGIAGIYPLDIAVSKKLLAEKMAEEKGFPLKLSVMGDK